MERNSKNDAFRSKDTGKETDNYGNECNRGKNKGRKVVGIQKNAYDSSETATTGIKKSKEDKMTLYIEIIKYALIGIIGIVICLRVFQLTKKLVRKWKDKDDIDLTKITEFDTL